jgi:hypothetical protein
MNSCLAIRTKYLPATNTRGSRIKATLGRPGLAPSVTLHYDHALNSEQNHARAMEALCAKRGLPAHKYRYSIFDGVRYWGIPEAGLVER